MKTFFGKFQLILLSPVFLPVIFAFGQNPTTNLQKYWKYRERLKNYVIVGDCQGCSEPSQSRDANNIFTWDDATSHLGYYIAMLATEYKLLSDQ